MPGRKTTPTPRSTGPYRNPRARSAILEAAFDLAGEVGYAKLTVEAIAARAGVGKQTIYRWWSSKGAVLFEAIRARSLGEGEQPDALHDTGDLEADLYTVLEAAAAELRDPAFDALLRALTAAILEDDDLAKEYRTSLEEPVREAKRARLRSAQQAGQLSADVDLDVVVDLVFAPLSQRWLLRTGPITDAYAREVVRLALAGLPAPVR